MNPDAEENPMLCAVGRMPEIHAYLPYRERKRAEERMAEYMVEAGCRSVAPEVSQTQNILGV
jgi:hypothetical protein